MEKYNIKNKNYIIDNIMKWLIFGIFIVVAPPFFNCLYRIIVRYNINYYEILPDVLLMVLSICCNLINITIDSKKNISRLMRWIICSILAVISLGCWGLYFLIYFSDIILKILNINIDKLSKTVSSKTLISNEISCTIIYTSIFIVLICAIIGLIIELKAIKKPQKNR